MWFFFLYRVWLLVIPFSYRSCESLFDRYSEVFNIFETTGAVTLDVAQVHESA